MFTNKHLVNIGICMKIPVKLIDQLHRVSLPVLKITRGFSEIIRNPAQLLLNFAVLIISGNDRSINSNKIHAIEAIDLKPPSISPV